MAILSFQSHVAYGHVGNSAAVFCLERIGHDVWPVNAVAFSNHPGYGSFGGRVWTGGEVAAIVDGLAKLDVLPRCRAVLSGYLGSTEIARVVLEAVTRVKAANPRALYCCDPVMGDREDGLYVADDLAAFFKREAIAVADVLIPNHFELEVLAERTLPTVDDAREAAESLLARGPRLVVVTSIATVGGESGVVANLAVSQTGAWTVTTPGRPLAAKGTGDVLAALFLGRFLERPDPAAALALAVSSTFAVVEATSAAGARELKLVESQAALADPPRRFAAVRMR